MSTRRNFRRWPSFESTGEQRLLFTSFSFSSAINGLILLLLLLLLWLLSASVRRRQKNVRFFDSDIIIIINHFPSAAIDQQRRDFCPALPSFLYKEPDGGKKRERERNSSSLIQYFIPRMREGRPATVSFNQRTCDLNESTNGSAWALPFNKYSILQQFINV